MSDLFSISQISTQPKSFVEDLSDFLYCLAKNYRRDQAYYKNFVFGDNGRPAYLIKVYPKILVNNIIHCREEVLYIVSEDLDFSELDDLLRIWSGITLRIVQNVNNFSVLPQIQTLSEKCFKVTNRSNNSIYIHYCGVPRSLEYQVARINMIDHNLCISNSIQNNDHDFLNEVVRLLNTNRKDLIENSVELLKEEIWLKEINKLIEDFECI